MKLLVKKLHPDAIIPKYQTKGAAGFDVHALITKDIKDSHNRTHILHTDYSHKDGIWEESPVIYLEPNSRFIVHTGLAFSVAEGYEMQIRPRSGLAAKHGITIVNSPGTLDNGYLNELFIILHNLGEENFIIRNGDRIAQCVINKFEHADFDEVEEFPQEVLDTDRGGGLGSTGIK